MGMRNGGARRWAACLALVLWGVACQVAAGTVVTREFVSKALGRPWAYAVYVPDGYASAALRYPVLYLLHGNGGHKLSWVNDGRIQQTADRLIASGEIPPCLIVMPDAGTSWFVDRTERMETAVIDDLVTEVEGQWKALSMRSGRLVGGLSMGGYGALRFALKYPERFGAAALLSPAIYDPEPPVASSARKVGVFGSPAFDPEVWKALNYPALWDAYLAKRQPVPMYINAGDDDEFVIEQEAARLYGLLRKHQQPAQLRIVDGAHVWAVWESTIGDAMKYLFRFAERPVVDAAPR